MKTHTLLFAILLHIVQLVLSQNIQEVYYDVNGGTPSSSYNEPGTVMYPVGYNAYSTKTPVIFVHGIIGKLTGSYEANIQGVLSYGLKAAFVQLDPIGTPENNGMLLKRMIDIITAHYGSATVSIVAHSKGGLDTERALYGRNPYDPSIPSFGYEKVDAVYTFGSPLKGSRVADAGAALSWTGIGWIAMWYLNGYDLTSSSVQEFQNWAQSWTIISDGTFRNYYNPYGASYTRINLIQDNTTRWWAHQSDDPCYENKWYFCYVGNLFHHTIGAYMDAWWEWDWFNSGWRNWHAENDGFIAVYRAKRNKIQNAYPTLTPGAGDWNYITMNDANHTSLWDPGQGHFTSEVAPYLHYGLYDSHRPDTKPAPLPDKPGFTAGHPGEEFFLSDGVILPSRQGKVSLIVEEDNAPYEILLLAENPVYKITLSRENNLQTRTLQSSRIPHFDPVKNAYECYFGFDNLQHGIWNLESPEKDIVVMARNLKPETVFGVKWNFDPLTGYKNLPVEIKISKDPGRNTNPIEVTADIIPIGNKNEKLMPEEQKPIHLNVALAETRNNSLTYTFTLPRAKAGEKYAIRVLAQTPEGEHLLQRNALTTVYIPEALAMKNVRINAQNNRGKTKTDTGFMEIYPNPASDKVYIKSLSGDIHSILLTDLSGKKITELSNISGNTADINTSAIHDGIYTLTICTASRVVEDKLVIKH